MQSNRLSDLWADGRHFIVKEFLKPEEWQGAPAREFRALELLAPLDIAPRPVFFEPALGPIVVYEYMEGRMWDRHRPSAADLTGLAQTWLQIHSVSAEGLWPSRASERSLREHLEVFRDHFHAYATWSATAFPAGRHAADVCLESLERCGTPVKQLAELPAPLCFCRADPRFANVIGRPDGRLGMIDWEDSGLRDPARELADLMTHPNQEDLLGADEWQEFLRPYLASRGVVDPQLAERHSLYLAIFPLFWLSLLLRRGMQLAETGALAGWAVNGMSAPHRLRRYLARALAWPGADFTQCLVNMAPLAFFPET